MSKSLNRNNEIEIDDRNLCIYLLDDYCTCEFVPLGTEPGDACEVCRYRTPETGDDVLRLPPVCKWLEDEVCCNGESPLVGDFPHDACLVCKYWETKRWLDSDS